MWLMHFTIYEYSRRKKEEGNADHVGNSLRLSNLPQEFENGGVWKIKIIKRNKNWRNYLGGDEETRKPNARIGTAKLAIKERKDQIRGGSGKGKIKKRGNLVFNFVDLEINGKCLILIVFVIIAKICFLLTLL